MALQPDHKKKILRLGALLEELAAVRAEGRTVAHCHGCFDIVHPGHVRHLEFASRQADVLVVTITGDSDIHKGAQRPYIPQELRAESLAALAFVDFVYIDPTPTAESIIESLRPDVYVKGREYETSRDPRFLRERAAVERHGGRVIFSSGDIVFSSSELIASFGRDARLETERLRLVCRRHGISAESLSDILASFAGLRVGVVGDVIVDRYVFCDALDVASESPMMSLAQLGQQTFLGGAAIVARHVASLGGQALLLSAAGMGEDTTAACRLLAEEGVRFHAVPARPALVEKTRFLVEESKILKVERGEVVPLDSVAERTAASVLRDWSRHLDVLIFCDFGYGTVTASLLDDVLADMRRDVAVIAADVSGSRGSLLNFENVDLLCPTEREIRSNLHDFDEGLSSVAWQLMNRTSARHLVCTLGKGGLVAFNRASQDRASAEWSQRLQSEHLPSLVDRCVDRLGCGDALLAVSSLALGGGASLMEAAYLGNAAAAVETGQLGNHPLQRADLLGWLHLRPELHADDALSAPRVSAEMATAAAG